MQTISRRYRMNDVLGEGGMGIVYHAYDRLNGQDVALKLVTMSDANLDINRSLSTGKDDTRSFRQALAQEFKILASLRHPHIISVLDYGFTAERQPFFTMELLRSAQQIDHAAHTCTQTEKVDLLIAMLRALAYLHRRGIVHRDLKPANVMVEAGGKVRVLDFGLSYSTDQVTTEGQTEISGTLAYMSPETLRGAAPSVQSDLYAAGTIAYEILTGEHPFAVDNVTALIQDILNTAPDLSPLPDSFKTIIYRMITKDLGERFESALAVIDALLEVADGSQHEESVEIRESYLQAASFVGREHELAQLTQSVKGLAMGEGSAWLISGESGVGKSRLMAELRTQALIEGVTVLRGQAVSDGGAPYQLWRDVMRWLVLLVDKLTEEEASVAGELVPDVARILARSVPPPPTITPQQAQERLLLVFENLLQRVEKPILIILEDLQWTVESLEVLKHLNKLVGTLGIMTVGTYRSDEKPKLPDAVPHDHLLQLQRLASDEIAQLSKRILGQNDEIQPLVELIEEQTEGNVFFIIEVIRSLADELQSLDEVALRTLPMTVFSGGMQKIVARRLERVPAAAQELLRFAAVFGRVIDRDLLRVLAPSADLDVWLLTCSEAAVLEVDADTWQFSHDKLREGVLVQLEPAAVRMLHRQVAEAIEHLYPDDETYFMALKNHWHQADVTDKERDYAQRVGDLMMQNFAMNEALVHYQRALDLTPAEQPETLHLMLKISELHSLGNHQQAKPLLDDAIALAETLDDPRGLARAYAQLGRMAMLRDGDWQSSELHLQQALTHARQTDDLSVLSGVLRQLGNLGIYTSNWDMAIPYLQESVRHAQALGDIYLEGMAVNSLSDAYAKRNQGDDHDLAIELSIRTRDIGRDLGHRRLVMMGIAHIGLVALHQEDYALAYEQFEEAYTITAQIHDDEQLGKVGNYVGICQLGLTDYEAAQATFVEALKISLEKKSMPEVIRSLTGIALIWAGQGQTADAVRLLTLTLSEPRCNTETHALADDRYTALLTQFPEAQQTELVAAGQAMDIEAVAWHMADHMVLPV